MAINSTNDIAQRHQDDLEHWRWRDLMEDTCVDCDEPYEPQPLVARDDYTEWARSSACVVNWAKFLVSISRGYGEYKGKWLNLKTEGLTGFKIGSRLRIQLRNDRLKD